MFIQRLTENDWEQYRALRFEQLELHDRTIEPAHEQSVSRAEAKWRTELVKIDWPVFGWFDKVGDTSINGLVGRCTIVKASEKSMGGKLVDGYFSDKFAGAALKRHFSFAQTAWLNATDYGLKHLSAEHAEGHDIAKEVITKFGLKQVGEEGRFDFGGQRMNSFLKYELRL